MGTNSHFRRNTAIVAGIHLLVLAIFFFVTRRPSEREIAWLDGGSPPGPSAERAGGEPVKPVAATESLPTPAPTPEREGNRKRIHRSDRPDPESQIVLRPPRPTPNPTPSATPSPSPTATATPAPTPAPTPEPTATPKPTPKSTPKPTPKSTPKPHPKKTPKPTPKPKPKTKPTPTPKPKIHQPAQAPDNDGGDEDADTSTAPKKTGEAAKAEGSSKSHASGTKTGEAAKFGGEGGSGKGKPGGTGTGAGGGHGAGHEGGGSRQSDFGWYYAMLHDRFYARWDQPISLLQGGQGFVTTVLIEIESNGHIGSITISKSSGNTAMDDSVMTAARRVTQVDPPPGGLGAGQVKIEFKLNP